MDFVIFVGRSGKELNGLNGAIDSATVDFSRGALQLVVSEAERAVTDEQEPGRNIAPLCEKTQTYWNYTTIHHSIHYSYISVYMILHSTINDS